MTKIEPVKNKKHEVIYPVTVTDAVKGLDKALSEKQETLVSGDNIRTINGQSLLGDGNIKVTEEGGAIVIDSKLSEASENPVQNKTIASAVNDLNDSLSETLRYTPSGEIDPNITPAEYATQEQFRKLEVAVSTLSGKYYGFYQDSSELPENINQDGYAFVGLEEPYTIWQFKKDFWVNSGVTAKSIQGEPGLPGVGFSSVETPTVADGTFALILSDGSIITIDMNHSHPEYFSKDINTIQPETGMLPDETYKLGTITGEAEFIFAPEVTGKLNHYYFTFSTSSPAPTITWPAIITKWTGNCVVTNTPIIETNRRYEVSVVDGRGVIYES